MPEDKKPKTEEKIETYTAEAKKESLEPSTIGGDSSFNLELKDDNPFMYDYKNRTIRKKPEINTYTIDFLPTYASGELTMSGSQSIAKTTNTKVTFDTQQVSSGITVDTSNNRFTITTAGNYRVSASLLYSQTEDSKLYQVQIWKNNGQTSACFTTSNVASGTRYMPVYITRILTLAVGDYIEIFAYHNCTVAQNIEALGHAYFNIDRIS